MILTITVVFVIVLVMIIGFTFMPVDIQTKDLISDYQNTVVYAKNLDDIDIVPTQPQAVQNQIDSIALNGNGAGIIGSNDPRVLWFPSEDTHKEGIKGSSGFYPRPNVGKYEFHFGYDITSISHSRRTELNILAATEGTVTKAQGHNSYGNYVEIKDNRNGFRYIYAHLSKINVKVGDVVKQGQAIGKMGATGAGITKVHLHFEVIPNLQLVDGNKVKLKKAPYGTTYIDPIDPYFMYDNKSKPTKFIIDSGNDDPRHPPWGDPGTSNTSNSQGGDD